MRKFIDILSFSKFAEYSVDFKDFCDSNGITLPNINSIKGQVIALLTHEENRNLYIDRPRLDSFLKRAGFASRDSIQAINKTDQWGLVHVTEDRKYYKIPYPFQFTDLHLKKRNLAKIGGGRDEKINFIKEYISVNYTDIKNDDWQIGHKDPNSTDSSEENLIYQPPIQGRYRDRFKFDDIGLTKWPTTRELENNFNKYYSDEEQMKILEILSSKFPKKL